MKNLLELAKSALGTAGAAGAVTVGGYEFGAPAWLIGLAQASVVVVGVLRGIDKREKSRVAEMATLRGEVQTLHGRLNGLACISPAATPPPVCPVAEEDAA